MRSLALAIAAASAVGLSEGRVIVIDGGERRRDVIGVYDDIPVATPMRPRPKPQPLFSGSIAQGKRTGGKHEHKREIERNLRRAAAKAAKP